MKKRMLSFTLMSTLFAGMVVNSSLAVDKIVVVPLGGNKAIGNATKADVLKGKTFSSDIGVDLTGTLEQNLESTGDAVAADVLAGKTFSNNVAVGITGTYEEGFPAPVASTGQTTPYATGDDGELQKGVAWPNPRFIDNLNGTVTDNLTGLIWLTKANCIQTDNAGFDLDITVGDGRVTWMHALDFIAGINAGTYICGDTSDGGAHQTDWRLPNRFEMESLFHLNFFNPMLSNAAGTAQWTDGDVFTDVTSLNFYWSSTTTPGSTNSAFAIDFWIGDVSSRAKTTDYFVWPVRSGQ